MNARLLAFALASLAMLPSPAAAAERNYTVTGFDRVRVDGPYRVKLKTGVAPFARASGSQRAIESLSVAVQGRTLIVRLGPDGWGGYPGESAGPVELSIGTHEIANAWVNGSGALEIDKVRGQSFDLSLMGAGRAAVAELDVDRLNLNITGSGSVRLGGKAANARASTNGTAQLDASALHVKDAVIGAEGSAVVLLKATETAKVDAIGLASVELGGRPACTVRAKGSAVVSGCR